LTYQQTFTLLLAAGTADNGNLHAFDVTEYQLLATWPFDDVTGSTDHVTSIACSPTNQHVAASAGQLVKVWDIRLATLDITIGVGDRGRGRVPPPPPKKSKKIFYGQSHVKLGNSVNFLGKYHKKFGPFGGKYDVKFGNFVNFSYIIFGQEFLPPNLTELHTPIWRQHVQFLSL